MNIIEQKVKSIVKYYKTRDPFLLCDEMGIIVVDCDLPETVNGIYTMLYGQNTVILNNRLDSIKRRVVCAHELGHIMLHDNLNCLNLESSTNFVVSKFETEADTFAAFLLIDDTVLQNEFSDFSPTAADDIATRFEVPEHLVKLRFNI